jgi:hypothetical protein
MLTREQILSRKPKRMLVDVPEWGGQITIQAMTAGAAQAMTKDHGLVDFVIASAINEDGTPMFSPEDRDELNAKEFSAVRRVAEAAITFNGLSPDAVEGLAKNSVTGLNGDSSSA